MGINLGKHPSISNASYRELRKPKKVESFHPNEGYRKPHSFRTEDKCDWCLGSGVFKKDSYCVNKYICEYCHGLIEDPFSVTPQCVHKRDEEEPTNFD